MSNPVETAVAQLGDGAFHQEALQRHVFPLFSRTLARDSIYLANHSLGRPLDQTREDLNEGFSQWQSLLDEVWEPWLAEQEAFRQRIARLIGAPRWDCVVPKTSAGQGLRAVLNGLPGCVRVVSTRGEFDSVDLILKQYGRLGRITVEWVDADEDGRYPIARLLERCRQGVDLFVISQVMFMSGERIEGLDVLADACHAVGARLLVDAYHAVGVFPVDVGKMGADYLIGGSYKYLRGGPGACFLWVSGEHLDAGFTSLDVGWFAKAEAFSYQRPDPPQLEAGGRGLLDGTPAVLTYYQSRAGQQFMLAAGAQRMRSYTLERLRRLKEMLAACGISTSGGDEQHGAFLTLRHAQASMLARGLAKRGVITDARGVYLRLSPDCLTTEAELVRAAECVAREVRAIGG